MEIHSHSHSSILIPILLFTLPFPFPQLYSHSYTSIHTPIPIPTALFPFLYFYSHSHSHSRDSHCHSRGIPTVPIRRHISTLVTTDHTARNKLTSWKHAVNHLGGQDASKVHLLHAADLRRFTIIACSCTMTSSSPSPVTAHTECTDHGRPASTSCSPSCFCMSSTLRLPGRSFLLATTAMGTPSVSAALAVRSSSTFASSSRSTSPLSTTNTIPSVVRVYDRHSGRTLSCPPTSQMSNVTPATASRRTRSKLKPMVGDVEMYWRNRSW